MDSSSGSVVTHSIQASELEQEILINGKCKGPVFIFKMLGMSLQTFYMWERLVLGGKVKSLTSFHSYIERTFTPIPISCSYPVGTCRKVTYSLSLIPSLDILVSFEVCAIFQNTVVGMSISSINWDVTHNNVVQRKSPIKTTFLMLYLFSSSRSLPTGVVGAHTMFPLKQKKGHLCSS